MNHEINNTPRGLVINLSVRQEETVNTILAKLLGINKDDSKSFGTSSQALSFNAKINLLLDLNYLDSIQREKFQLFMEIRNKFAHIHKVDTFEKCFELTGNYQRLKKIINKKPIAKTLEIEMHIVFCELSVEMSNILINISENIHKGIYIRSKSPKNPITNLKI